MRKKSVLFLVLVVALVLGVASAALGVEATPTLTASRTMVTYPHSAYLVSNAPTSSFVFRRLAGASEWTTFAPVGAARTYVIRPKSTAGYKVVTDGAESDTVTISVAAQLSKPQVNRHGHRWHKLTLKGWVAPLHEGGNVQLTFFRLEKVSTIVITKRNGKGHDRSRKITKYQWVKQGDSVDVSLSRRNSQKSKWSYRWMPTEKGAWKVVVSHEDVAHVYSSASNKFVIKR